MLPPLSPTGNLTHGYGDTDFDGAYAELSADSLGANSGSDYFDIAPAPVTGQTEESSTDAGYMDLAPPAPGGKPLRPPSMFA